MAVSDDTGAFSCGAGFDLGMAKEGQLKCTERVFIIERIQS